MFDEEEGKINEKVDIYAFGMVLYEMATNSIPFSGKTTGQILTDILVKQRRPIIPPSCDPDMKKIIQDSWHQEAIERPSIIQILSKLDFKIIEINPS